MTYLTAQWEAEKLRKMSDKSIWNEANFIITQVQRRNFQIYLSMSRNLMGIEEELPIWKLIEDVQGMNDQFQRIIDELNRRRI